MKTQMKFQKILTLLSLIFAALTILYSFFYCGGMLCEVRYYKGNQYFVEGATELYNYSQSANNVLVIISIILLLCVVLNYLMASNKRRNYYITNYIAIGILVAVLVGCAITFFVVMGQSFALCGKVDLNAWYTWYSSSKVNPQHYSESRITLILGIVVAVLMLIVAAAWVLNTVWKVKLMQGEKALLNGNEVKEAA